jgi:hypothetical protein
MCGPTAHDERKVRRNSSDQSIYTLVRQQSADVEHMGPSPRVGWGRKPLSVDTAWDDFSRPMRSDQSRGKARVKDKEIHKVEVVSSLVGIVRPTAVISHADYCS